MGVGKLSEVINVSNVRFALVSPFRTPLTFISPSPEELLGMMRNNLVLNFCFWGVLDTLLQFRLSDLYEALNHNLPLLTPLNAPDPFMKSSSPSPYDNSKTAKQDRKTNLTPPTSSTLFASPTCLSELISNLRRLASLTEVLASSLSYEISLLKPDSHIADGKSAVIGDSLQIGASLFGPSYVSPPPLHGLKPSHPTSPDQIQHATPSNTLTPCFASHLILNSPPASNNVQQRLDAVACVAAVVRGDNHPLTSATNSAEWGERMSQSLSEKAHSKHRHDSSAGQRLSEVMLADMTNLVGVRESEAAVVLEMIGAHVGSSSLTHRGSRLVTCLLGLKESSTTIREAPTGNPAPLAFDVEGMSEVTDEGQLKASREDKREEVRAGAVGKRDEPNIPAPLIPAPPSAKNESDNVGPVEQLSEERSTSQPTSDDKALTSFVMGRNSLTHSGVSSKPISVRGRMWCDEDFVEQIGRWGEEFAFNVAIPIEVKRHWGGVNEAGMSWCVRVQPEQIRRTSDENNANGRPRYAGGGKEGEKRAVNANMKKGSGGGGVNGVDMTKGERVVGVAELSDELAEVLRERCVWIFNFSDEVYRSGSGEVEPSHSGQRLTGGLVRGMVCVAGCVVLEWVNGVEEKGLPYDLIVTATQDHKEMGANESGMGDDGGERGECHFEGQTENETIDGVETWSVEEPIPESTLIVWQVEVKATVKDGHEMHFRLSRNELMASYQNPHSYRLLLLLGSPKLLKPKLEPRSFITPTTSTVKHHTDIEASHLTHLDDLTHLAHLGLEWLCVDSVSERLGKMDDERMKVRAVHCTSPLARRGRPAPVSSASMINKGEDSFR
eukprot:GHVN01004286.1.p1 GENE.GHVN01004286.1~~GHVN01004286.1.p1  ORF type:complete len:837 (+),score=190.94 GHVN01004286.1:2530-5040(+)